MMRKTVAMLLLVGLGSGCLSTGPTNPALQPKGFNQAYTAPRNVPGIIGPRGEAIAIGRNGSGAMPYGQARVKGDIQQASSKQPSGGVVQAGGIYGTNPTPIQQVAGGFGPPHTLPPGSRHALHSGFGGQTGPIAPPVPPMGPPGAVAAVGALPLGANPLQINGARTSILFAEPPGMRVSWLTGGFGEHVIETPGRYNFLQGGIYRLKLSNIPSLPNKELYPTIEVIPAVLETATFLAHSSVPVTFTEEDFEQVSSGNFLIKVIYLPNPNFQDIAALAGPNEIVSTRLEPGVDPIVEATKRGKLLMIVRMGNIDLQAPNTPAMDAPNPFNTGGPTGPGGPIMMAPESSSIPPSMGGGSSSPIPGIPIVPSTTPNVTPIPSAPAPIQTVPSDLSPPPIMSTPSTPLPRVNGPVGQLVPPPDLPARLTNR